MAIQRIFNRTVLGKMGIVRTAPSIIATAPTCFGGLGIMSFEVQQLLSHLSLIMLHGPDVSSMTHQLLRVTMESYALLEAGLPGDPASLPSVSYSTPKCWITQTLHSMAKYDISLQSGFTGLSKWCQDDKYIMDRMRLFFSGSSLATVNKVRMYLRIVTWSDLVSADGKHYDTDLLQGIRGDGHPSPSFSRYHWPTIPPPSTAEKQVWTHSLHVAFGITGILGFNSSSHLPRWTQEAIQYARWLYDPIHDVIYERKGSSCWRKWCKVQGLVRSTRATANTYAGSEVINLLPDTCTMVSIVRRGVNIIRQGLGEQMTSNRQRGTPQMARHHSKSGIHYFLYHIQLNNGMIISDGSYDNGKMTYAYVAQPVYHEKMEDIDYSQLVHGAGHVSGDILDSNSYRAELAGMLAAIKFTSKMCTNYQVGKGICTIHCDNKGALSAVFGHKRPTPRWASYDLVRQLRQAVASAPIVWKYKHVKGHQDNAISFSHLDSSAQGNVIADHLATVQQEKDPCTNQTPQNWVPTINGRMIGGNLDSRLKAAIYSPAMKQRWGKIFGIEHIHQNILDWDLFFRCLSTQHSKAQIFWTKFNARLLPVGTNLKQRRHSDSESCPCCGLPEDHDHLIQCKHPAMEHQYGEIVAEISDMLREGTNDLIAGYIMDLLKYFRQRTDEEDYEDYSETASPVENLQRSLGPRCFYAGLWSTQWHTLQDRYLQNIRSRRSATVWLSNLIHMVHRIPYLMWHTRNQILHQNTDNFTLQERHTELDALIDNLYSKKPHPRYMAHCDNYYFTKQGCENVKKMTIRRKINWIAGANLIMAKYDRVPT
jgi:hypothetical protein